MSVTWANFRSIARTPIVVRYLRKIMSEFGHRCTENITPLAVLWDDAKHNLRKIIMCPPDFVRTFDSVSHEGTVSTSDESGVPPDSIRDNAKVYSYSWIVLDVQDSRLGTYHGETRNQARRSVFVIVQPRCCTKVFASRHWSSHLTRQSVWLYIIPDARNKPCKVLT